MVKMPKRKKSNDNPYTLTYSEEMHEYCISFFDVKNNLQEIAISKELFETFDKFELEDISQMHKYDKYIEHSELFEETLHRRAFNHPESIEQVVENKITNQLLRSAILNLTPVQQKRIIMYYFENKTLREIAKLECCTYVSIKNSLDNAIKKLKKMLN